jgi:hypothetical protein
MTPPPSRRGLLAWFASWSRLYQKYCSMHRDGRGRDRQAASTTPYTTTHFGRQICASCCHEPVHSLASTVTYVTKIPCRQASVINRSANRAGRQLLAWLNPGRHRALSSRSARALRGVESGSSGISPVLWSFGAGVWVVTEQLCVAGSTLLWHILHRIGSTACSTSAGRRCLNTSSVGPTPLSRHLTWFR